MAYVNVLDWKAEQVADWLRGLEDTVYPYAHFFLNNDVTGQGLLNLTVDDLYKLHVEKLGHQEIILESLELLRNFHYNLDQENLQYISLRLSCKARSLYNEMCMKPPKAGEKQVVVAPVMSAVADVLESVRHLLSWLERKPFDRSDQYHAVRTTLISHSLELATNTQRDTFAEQPLDVIRSCCDKLGTLADKVIQEFTDSLILQPASLDMATVRKRADEDLGVVVESPQPGVHLVTETRMLNPSARLEPGDEIVQVNYQTVVGWQSKKVLQLMAENPVELILTLKKRPRHSNLGQIYMKPFRIPARKKSGYYINNLPSPRTELLVVPDVSLPILPKHRHPSDSSSDLPLSDTEEDSEDDEAFLPVAAAEVAGQIQRQSTASPTASLRSVLSRPRSAPQRRATISGTSPSQYRNYINVGEIWAGLRDTSVDFPSSTISSKDSGRSTMSSSKQTPEKLSMERPEMRHRTVTSVRPVTISTCFPTVTSAPNPGSTKTVVEVSKPVSSSRSMTTRPRMPDPPSELPGELVNVIHVTGASPSVPTPPYINVPTKDMPEYVDMTEYDEMPSEDQQPAKPPYVNVPIDPTASPNRQPLPKPRATRGSCSGGPGGTLPEEGGLHSRLSESSHSPHQPRGSSSSSSSSCRGKRPVPLPRRVSSLPTAPQTLQQGGAPRLSTPGPLPTASPSKSAPTAPSCPRGAVSGGAGARSNTSSQRRRCTTEIPTPTANYKSYRRVLPPEVSRRSSGVEAGSGSVRHRIGAPPAPAPAPPPSSPPHTAPVTKSRSMTRLTLDTAAAISVRTPPRLTEPPARHSSISSCDSGHGSFPTSPLRLQPSVRNGAKPGPDFLRRQSSSASSTASQQSVEERRNRRRSAVLREEEREK